MNIPAKMAVYGAALSIIGGLAYAQEESSGQSSSSTQKAPVEFKKSSDLGGQNGLAMQPGQKQVLFVASKLIGKTASSPQGQNLGKLSEIVFGPEQGIFGIIDFGAQQRAAIPWQLVTAVTESAVVVNTTQSALSNAPALKGGKNYENFNDPQFTQQLFSYYHVKKEGMGSSGSSSQESGSGSSSSQDPSSQDKSSSKDDSSKPDSPKQDEK